MTSWKVDQLSENKQVNTLANRQIVVWFIHNLNGILIFNHLSVQEVLRDMLPQAFKIEWICELETSTMFQVRCSCKGEIFSGTRYKMLNVSRSFHLGSYLSTSPVCTCMERPFTARLPYSFQLSTSSIASSVRDLIRTLWRTPEPLCLIHKVSFIWLLSACSVQASHPSTVKFYLSRQSIRYIVCMCALGYT